MKPGDLSLIGSLLLAVSTLTGAAWPGRTTLQPDASASAHSAAPVLVINGDPESGKRLYQVCTGCHSLDENDVGPRHRGVVGRKAGSVAGYAYSDVLRDAGITWTPRALNDWLKDPQLIVPGSKMYFSIADQQQRADIIAYLATEN